MGPNTPRELKLCQSDMSQAYVWDSINRTNITCRPEATSLSDVGTSIGSSISFQYEKLKYEFMTGPIEGAVFYLLLLIGALIWGWVCIRSITR